MDKSNCWEILKCGRLPGGENEAEFGVCPAAVNISVNRMNGGKNAGRYCWRIAGTMCNGKVCGSFAVKAKDCASCEFYSLVRQEEGDYFKV